MLDSLKQSNSGPWTWYPDLGRINCACGSLHMVSEDVGEHLTQTFLLYIRQNAGYNQIDDARKCVEQKRFVFLNGPDKTTSAYRKPTEQPPNIG
ncbi:MAG: hypothetical protein V2I33_20225 [Kangiellaceae bacterium]|jgi:hypothetical protein|nr:hypothetical protein [Kangiellaceae bacterium]